MHLHKIFYALSLFSMRNTKGYHVPLYYHIFIGNFTLTSPTVTSDITSVSVVIKYMFPMT